MRTNLNKLLDGSQEFKDRYEELMVQVEAQRNKMWLTPEQVELQNAVTEEQYLADMDGELDEQLQKIAAIENSDYTVSAEALAELQ